VPFIQLRPSVSHRFRGLRLAAAISAWLLLAPGLADAQYFPGTAPITAQSPAQADAQEGLSAELFYKLLLGDVALQRGDVMLAARAYYEAARESRDPRIARRATEVALATRQRNLAQEAAKLWLAVEPGAERPRQVLSALASGASGKDLASDPADDDIRVRLEKLLADAALSGQGVGEIFVQLNQFFAQQPDRKQVYELVRGLAAPYPSSPEAHFALALAAYNAGVATGPGKDSPLVEVDRALELRPGWERAVLLKAEIISRSSNGSAIAYLKSFVAGNPDARAAIGALAQLYVEQGNYAEARVLFQGLWDRDRNAREFEFGVAAISAQMKDWATAEALFLDLKRAGYGENGAVEFYLAQISDEQQRYPEAIERYLAVPDGERAWLAKLRVAALMAKQGQIAQARRYLAELPAVTVEQRVQVRQAEAALLRDANDNVAAYELLKRALAEYPDSPELLYDAAMVAEKLDKIDEAESSLRRVVELKPDDAQALNALGYTLVDRTPRTSEGFALIEKAHKLSPDDPFILDSMGWALYRLGKLDDAESYLSRAMKERPDAEIAAHLGEVVWKKGDTARAKEIWQSQLQATPDNQVLLETVRRYVP
jgi:tetratricopeptide (TPR) repeat protein